MPDQVAIELAEPPLKRLQRRLLDARYLLLGLVSRWLLQRDEKHAFDQLRTFCTFVGHGRSGGSLVGALMNAHPSIVMSNELNALRRLSNGITANQLYRMIYLVSKRQVKRGSQGGGGYSYAVPGQWQGTHRELLVIGDRKAGATAYEISRNPTILDLLDRKVRLDKKFIHVVRNPFNTVATTYLKTLQRAEENSNAHLLREIDNYFARCEMVLHVERKFGRESLHYIHQECLITEPERQLTRLCDFLGVEAFPDYLNACAGIIMKSPHETRNAVEWPESHIDAVQHGMKRFHWLAGYEPDS